MNVIWKWPSPTGLRPVPVVSLAAVGLLALPALGGGTGTRPTTPATGTGAARTPETPVDLEKLASGAGLKGTMHGANRELGTYVFTWAHPGGFFRNENLSLVAGTPEIEAQLAALDRHQAAVVWGKLVRVTAGQSHVRVEKVEPGEKWDPGVKTEPRDRPDAAALARRLGRRKQLEAMVHAISTDGSALVVEYRDEVIPVQVPPTEALRKQVAGLYRGDRIRFRYTVAEYPKRPLHLVLTSSPEADQKALEVQDGIHAQHEKERTLEGNLVLFPKSPALRRAIWGVEEKGPDGLHRYFTIFNFDDLKDQDAIDAMLQAAWSGEPRGVKDARNKYVHTKVRVRVTGKVSNPAQNQANPTLITRSTQVEITVPRRRDRQARAGELPAAKP